MPPRTSVTDPPAPEELGNLQTRKKKTGKGEIKHCGGNDPKATQSWQVLACPCLQDALHAHTNTHSTSTVSKSHVLRPPLRPFKLTQVWEIPILLQRLFLVGLMGPKSPNPPSEVASDPPAAPAAQPSLIQTITRTTFSATRRDEMLQPAAPSKTKHPQPPYLHPPDDGSTSMNNHLLCADAKTK